MNLLKKQALTSVFWTFLQQFVTQTIGFVVSVVLARLFFTEKRLPAVPYFRTFMFTGILYPIHAYNLNILNVKGRSDLFLKLELIKKIITVIVILIAFQFGIYGLLFGSVLISFLAFFLNTHHSEKFIKYTTWENR